MIHISDEARDILKEIIEHEKDSDYWKNKFENLSDKEDTILRGSFKELKDAGIIQVKYYDDYPAVIRILKNGYFYEEQIQREEYENMSEFEKELEELLDRTKTIKSPINTAPISIDMDRYNMDSEIWMNDVEIFHDKYLKEHSLSNRISTLLFQRKYNEIVACLKSIRNDKDFIEKMNGVNKTSIPVTQIKNIPEYDVFISHANKDKDELVKELYDSLNKLGITIFYDDEAIDWGDIWKKKILEGTKKSEFAIIVISENFFDREWTERELKEFLDRQNENGQKLILPILHNITYEQLKEKYPSIADIQGIETEKFTCDQISIMFAKQLIKRYKSVLKR